MIKKQSHFLVFIFWFFAFANCVNERNERSQKANEHVVTFPLTIEFGAIGKGANLPPTIIEINSDIVIITKRQKGSITEIESHAIKTANTRFIELFTALQPVDLEGNKDYYHSFIRDGDYMKVSNNAGVRKFSNTFSAIGDPSNIKPDTLGLSKFKNISDYSKLLLREMGE